MREGGRGREEEGRREREEERTTHLIHRNSVSSSP